jgi:hypothetical protein
MKYHEKQIRNELNGSYMRITEEESCMFDNIDSFLALSRENTSVREVELYPSDSRPGNYEFWDKVGQIVGNLMELKEINIHFLPYSVDDNNDGDEAHIPVWEIIARILTYVQRKISLYPAEVYHPEVEQIRCLARVIHGHPMISGFTFPAGFTFANLGPWCSALTTLPSLERVTFGLREPEIEDLRVLLNLEPFMELLRTPALRYVRFALFHFTNELCHVLALALEVGSSITDITFDNQCTFPEGGRATIVNALKTNATVTDVGF